MLKIKKFDDAEAVVVGHNEGTGWCEGMMGAIRVYWKGKKHLKFKIGSGFDKHLRMNPPKIGSTVTFKYQGLTDDGIPRFPIFLREHPGM